MATYYGTGRSNYFKVKDVEKFKSLLDRSECDLIWKGSKTSDELDSSDLVGFIPLTEDGQVFIPEDQETNFWDDVSSLLQEGQILIFQSVGSEKTRYINGISLAINCKGDILEFSLDEIYERAKDYFQVDEITQAIY